MQRGGIVMTSKNKIINLSYISIIFVVGMIFFGGQALANVTSVVPNSPPNATYTNNSTQDFSFTAVSSTNLTFSCHIVVGGVTTGTNTTVSNNTLTTITSTPVSDGNYLWNVSCMDSGNYSVSESRAITFDTIAPNVTSITTSDSLLTQADVGNNLIIDITFSEPMNQTQVLTPPIFSPDIVGSTLQNCNSQSAWVNSTVYRYNCTIVDGNLEIPEVNLTVATATDLAGNLQNSNLSVGLLSVDTIAPTVTFVSPTTANGTYARDYIEANMTASGTSLDTMNISIYNSSGSIVQSAQGTSSPLFLNATSLPSGTYYLNATANDSNGNIGSTTNMITLDTTPPTPIAQYVITNPKLAKMDNSTVVMFQFNWSEPMNMSVNATVTFTPNLEGTSFTACQYYWDDSDTSSYNCTFIDNNETIPFVNITITGGQDANGNNQITSYTYENVTSIDTISPIVGTPEIDPQYNNGSAFFVSSTINIFAAVSDSSGAINATSCAYSFNGTLGPWDTTGASYNGTHCLFTNINTTGMPGSKDIGVYVEDTYTNNATNALGPFYRDVTAPTTTATGNNGASYTFDTWSGNEVLVTLNCADTGSGCNATYYCTNTSDSCIPNMLYTGAINISNAGTTYVRYSSIDNVNNSEAIGSSIVKIDRYPVNISSDIQVTPDRFACALGGSLDANENVTIKINATDDVGVLYVMLNASLINPTSGLINTTYNTTSGLWEATFAVENTSNDNFTVKNVTIIANDSAGNGYMNWGADQPYTYLTLYNLTQPEFSDSCYTQGAGSTNICKIINFNNVTLVNEIALNGSASCNNGTTMPWGDTFSNVAKLSFLGINLSSSDIGQKLENLQQAISVVFTTPGQFGDSHVYVNSTAFAELNSSTIINLYGLPFSEAPSIISPAGENATNSSVVQDIPYTIPMGAYNLTVPRINLTFTVSGFSQYNITDNVPPTIVINSPTATYYANTSVLINVTVNGTGTQLSNISLNIDGINVHEWNNSMIYNSCTNLTVDWDVVTCPYMANNLSEGTHILNVTAYDLGGISPGNMAYSEVTFGPDLTAPNTTADESGAWHKVAYNVTLSPIDGGSGVNYTSYSIDGSAQSNGTVVNINTQGNHTVTFYSVDNVGNTEPMKNVSSALDLVAPTTTYTPPTGWQGSVVTINLSATDNLSGVDYTSYNISGTWMNGTTYTINTTGNYTVNFYSVDNAGNVEATNNANILVDLTAPTTTAVGTASNGSVYEFGVWSNNTALINLTATDSQSGVNITKYCNDTANTCTPDTNYTGPINITTPGTNYLRFRSVDNVNNTETTNFKKVLILSENSTMLNTTTTVSGNTTQVAIPTNNTAGNITVENGINATLNLGASINTTAGNATTSGAINVETNTSVGMVNIELPENMTLSGNASWMGIINLPTIKATSTVNVTADSGYTATTDSVIEIGFNDVSLTSDSAIRINVSGKAGKYVGYFRDGIFTKIATTCSADTQVAGDALSAGGDCKIDVGSDLIIWTKHFTKFVTYTQTATSSSSTSSGSTTGGPAVETNIKTEKAFQLGTINASSDKTATFTGVPITSVKINSASEMNYTKITVSVLKAKPSGISAPSGSSIYSDYMNISIEAFPIVSIVNAKITFGLSKTWLTQNGLTSGDVILYRYTNKWIKLETKMTSQDSQNYYFEATTPGFSYFVIGAEKETTTTPSQPTTTKPTPTQGVSDNTTNNQAANGTTSGATDSGTAKSKSSPWWIWLIIVIVVAAISVVLMRRKQPHKKHHQK